MIRQTEQELLAAWAERMIDGAIDVVRRGVHSPLYTVSDTLQDMLTDVPYTRKELEAMLSVLARIGQERICEWAREYVEPASRSEVQEYLSEYGDR